VRAADLVTALLLFLVLGRQWLLLPGLALEAIPGFGVLPFWLLVVWGDCCPGHSSADLSTALMNRCLRRSLAHLIAGCVDR
jgi:hypothetical protein